MRTPHLLPGRVHAAQWSDLQPRSRAHWIACMALWSIFGAFLISWTGAHWGYLTDPMLQNDDARTTLFPFHRFGPDRTLWDDPVTNDVIGNILPVQWLVYRTLTPLVGLQVASKLVQVICLSLIGLAGLIVARSRRGGLAAALLLVFLFLHTPYVVNRIGGGHPRGFAFGLLALWTAGALVGRSRTRFVSTVVSAALYPPAMILLLGAEGLMSLRGWPSVARPVLAARLRQFAVLVAICVAIIVPQVMMNAGHGHMHTLAEARQDPIFTASPRDILPFANPIVCSINHLAHPLYANGSGLLINAWSSIGLVGPMAVLLALGLFVVVKRTPARWATAALLGSAAVAYLAARLLAFRLYNPERYLSYGMVAVTLALLVTSLGLVHAWVRGRERRAVWRSSVACAAIGLIWLVAGDGAIRRPEQARDGIVHHNGMSIDGRTDGDLYAFIAALPPDVRIAMHPMDGAGVTYWTGRATTEHFETLQPWLVEPWQRLRDRTARTLEALYAIDVETLLAYCDERQVTHLLVHAGRYSDEFQRHAGFFAPFDRIAARAVSDIRREQMVIPQVARESTVFYRAPWIMLDVERIRRLVTAGRQAAADGDPTR